MACESARLLLYLEILVRVKLFRSLDLLWITFGKAGFIVKAQTLQMIHNVSNFKAISAIRRKAALCCHK